MAGYRALFTCSAHFFAGRPLEDIKKVELVDVEGMGYPDPVIDERRKIVTATDISGQIVRIAAFRETMGCSVLPPDWQMGDVPRLPYVEYAPPPDVGNVPFPAGDRVKLPADGLDTRYRALAPVLDRAFDGRSYADVEGVVTTAVIVVKDGRIIAERYRPGFGIYSGYRTWSTAKSISSALLAIAAKQGLLDLDAPVSIPEWGYPGDPRQAITYKQLLWMSSGLFSGGANTNAIYFGGQDVVSAATTTPLEVAPGTRWKYANNDTLLLLRALRHRLADDLRYLRFPYDELLHPLGMYHTRMEVDHLGNFVGSSQTYTTARDLARFGILLANDGVWNGKRLLPEGWVKFSATAGTHQAARGGSMGLRRPVLAPGSDARSASRHLHDRWQQRPVRHGRAGSRPGDRAHGRRSGRQALPTRPARRGGGRSAREIGRRVGAGNAARATRSKMAGAGAAVVLEPQIQRRADSSDTLVAGLQSFLGGSRWQQRSM